MVNINMSDPRIAMGVRAPSIPTSFSNALMNIKNLGENREIATARKQQRGVDEQDREFKSLVNIAQQANTLTSPESKLQFVKQQQARAQDFKLPTPNLDQYISMAESGDVVGAQSLIDNTIQLGMRSGLVKTQSPISRKISAPITLFNPKTKQKILVSPSANPITGEPELKKFDIPEGFQISRETPDEKRTGDVIAAGDKQQLTGDIQTGQELDRIIQSETGTTTGRQDIQLKQIQIDETKIKNVEKKQQAIDSKNTRRNEADASIKQIDNLLLNDNFSNAFGKVIRNTPDVLKSQESIDAIANVEQILGLLSLESREKLKGQGTITDSEMTTLEKSATVLANPFISDKLARKELRRVRRIFEDASDRNALIRDKTQTQQQVDIDLSDPNISIEQLLEMRKRAQ